MVPGLHDAQHSQDVSPLQCIKPPSHSQEHSRSNSLRHLRAVSGIQSGRSGFLNLSPENSSHIIGQLANSPKYFSDRLLGYQGPCSRMELARRLLTTPSNPLDIFSSQRLLDRGEILRM